MGNVQLKLLASGVLIFCNLLLYTQQVDIVQGVVGRYVEIWAENEISEEEISFMAEELYALSESPVSLNASDLSTLVELHLLSEYQVVVIEHYRASYGSIQTIWEIALLPEFTEEDIRLLSPFVTVEIVENFKGLSDFFRYNKSEIIGEYKRNLQKADGYLGSDTEPPAYAGSADKLYLRYKFTSKRDLSIGITAKKDPGEPFFKAPRNDGFDYYSAHAYIKLDRFLKEISIGDYTVHFGNGLTLGSGVMSGKGAQAVNLKDNKSRIRKYSSATEFGFMRGVAASFQHNSLQSILFASFRKVDANIKTDTSINEAHITSLPQTGYHRTETELQQRNAANQTVVGANIQCRLRKLKVGLQGVVLKYNFPIEQNDALYRLFEISPDYYLNMSTDYQYINRGVVAWGEVALDKNYNYALLQGIHFKASDIAQIAIHYRKYSPKYNAPLSNSFGDSDNSSNEEGLYAGMLLYPFSHVEVNAYVDLFRYPWLTYRRSLPSQGYDYMIDLRWSPKSTLRFSARCRIKETKYDVLSDTVIPYFVAPETVSRIHLQSDISLTEWLSSQTRFAATFFDDIEGAQTGWMLYQELTWKILKFPARLSGRYVIFNTDSYDTRIYAYEKDVLYAFSIPALSGAGTRYYLVATWDISERITLYTKWSQTIYLNEYELGSGNERIDGNTRSQFTVKLKMVF